VWEPKSEVRDLVSTVWESACGVWELKGEVWDLSSHQLPLNLTPGLCACSRTKRRLCVLLTYEDMSMRDFDI